MVCLGDLIALACRFDSGRSNGKPTPSRGVGFLYSILLCYLFEMRTDYRFEFKGEPSTDPGAYPNGYREAEREWAEGAKDRPISFDPYCCHKRVQLFDGPWFEIRHELPETVVTTFTMSDRTELRYCRTLLGSYLALIGEVDEEGDEEGCRSFAKALYAFLRANAQAKRDLYRALKPEGWEPGCDLTPSSDSA